MDDKYLFFSFVSLTSDIQHKTPSGETDQGEVCLRISDSR